VRGRAWLARRDLRHTPRMSLAPELRERIEALLDAHDVVVFMKGVRAAPRCGFSARAVEVLDKYLDHYHSIDVIEDAEIREAIKLYSEWPTIPQVFVGRELVGGTDILLEMDQTGEIVEALGPKASAPKPPSVKLTTVAAHAIKSALADAEEGDSLRLKIDARFYNDLSIGPREAGDLEIEVSGLVMRMDPATARRANGLVIDFLSNDQGSGFKLDNPNAPAGVRDLSVRELKHKLDAGDEFVFIDVRTPGEAMQAKIEGARLLDDDVMTELRALPKDTPLVFHCHHGGRSLRAAQHFVDLGFSEVYNVVGGIDAWSLEIDPSVPRY
jgi:monothiol glutaredoxin